MTLSHQHHFFRFGIGAGPEPVKVNAAGNAFGIPRDVVNAGFLALIDQACHLTAEHVMDFE